MLVNGFLTKELERYIRSIKVITYFIKSEMSQSIVKEESVELISDWKGRKR